MMNNGDYKRYCVTDCCSGHGRSGMQRTAHGLVTPINLHNHTQCRSVTVRRWADSDGVCVVCVLRRRSLVVLSAAAQRVVSAALCHCSAVCATTECVATCSLKSSRPARAMTSALPENSDKTSCLCTAKTSRSYTRSCNISRSTFS